MSGYIFLYSKNTISWRICLPLVVIHKAEETSINLRSKILFRRPSAIIHVDPANLLADQTFIESSQIMKADYYQIIFLNLIYIHICILHTWFKLRKHGSLTLTGLSKKKWRACQHFMNINMYPAVINGVQLWNKWNGSPHLTPDWLSCFVFPCLTTVDQQPHFGVTSFVNYSLEVLDCTKCLCIGRAQMYRVVFLTGPPLKVLSTKKLI